MFLRHKISYLAIGAIAIVFLAGNLFFSYEKNDAPDAQAAAADNVMGFAWSENIGWISFNSLNCDTNGNTFIDDNITTPGCDGLDNNTTPVVDYGVNLNAGNTLSGYAWSENIGWIKLDPSPDFATGLYPNCLLSTCPGGSPNYPAKYDSASKKITGWARACAGTVNGDCNSATRTDGWDGWILMGPVDKGTGDNGVWIDNSLIPNEFKGWAWGSDVVGWISFNHLTGGSAVEYKVYISAPLNNPPAVSGLTTNKDSINYCSSSFLSINLSWNFTDTEDANQTSYKLKITRSDGAVYDPGVKSSITPLVSGSYIQGILPGFLRYNSSGAESYSWEVTVYDSFGASDGPKAGPVFSFPKHQYPDIGFAPPPPASFLVNTPIDFTVFGNANADNTKCYPAGDNTDCKQWEWDFDYNGVFLSDKTIIGNNGNWTHTYNLPSSSYKVVLQVTDNDDYICSNSDSPEVLGAISPKWKEVIPR